MVVTGAGNLCSPLLELPAQQRERTAVIDLAGQVSYGRLREDVRRLAGAFSAAGVTPGDVVSFQLPNWIEAVAVHQAAAWLGAVTNPILPIFRERELRYILGRSRAKLVVVPASFRGTDHLRLLRRAGGDLDELGLTVVVDKFGERPELVAGEVEYADFLTGGTPAEAAFAPPEEHPALLLYTSGTTAEPKGVLHTHATLGAENRTIIELFGLTGDDVIFMPSPVTHITGLAYGLELPAMIGAPVVLQDVWNAGRARQTVIEHGATWTIGATPFLDGLVREVEANGGSGLALRAFACGGADVPSGLVRRATAVLGCFVTRVYGSSEHPTVSCCGPADPIEKAASTDGRVMPGSRVRVLDDRGRDLDTGAVGELAVTGPELFRGYLGASFGGEGFTRDGWFLTGDLGSLDEDGYLTIHGRKKDIIIRGGENISAKEVEDLLIEHPDVDAVAVVAMPDPVLGERACAFAVLAERSHLTLAELSAFMLDRGAAKHKLPERLELVTELPTTASGKVQKFVLRRRLAGPDGEGGTGPG